MQKHEFIRDFEILKPVLYGRGQEVAQKAGVHYETYLRYSKGEIRDLNTAQKILEAAQSVAREIKAYLNQVI